MCYTFRPKFIFNSMPIKLNMQWNLWKVWEVIDIRYLGGGAPGKILGKAPPVQNNEN